MMNQNEVPDIVEVNVGGHIYTTSRTTLTKYNESNLADMFDKTAGKLNRDSQHRYFIDRDGGAFRHVLNFLRTNQAVMPDSDEMLEMLRAEAEYYGLHTLMMQLSRLADLTRHITIQAHRDVIVIRGKVDIPELSEIKRSWPLLNQGQNIHDSNYIVYECSKERGAQAMAPFCTLQMKKKHPQTNVAGHITDIEKEWLADLLRQKGWRLISRSVTTNSNFDNEDSVFAKRQQTPI